MKGEGYFAKSISKRKLEKNPRSMLSTIKSRIFTKDISEEERRNKEEKKQE